MATTTPKTNLRRSTTAVILTGIVLAMSVFFLQACSKSSDTRSEAQNAVNSSGEYQVNATIQSPLDGSTIAWLFNATTGEFETDTEFNASATGGSGSYTFTWVIDGPTTSVQANGEDPDEITLAENGILTITLTVVDSDGLSDSETITVNSEVGGLTNFRLRITEPVSLVYTLGETVRTTVEINGGSGRYAVLWESDSPASPMSSTAVSQVWQPQVRGVYTFKVTVTDLVSGEVLIGSVTVTVN